jgi:hypothetical protein
VAGEFAVVGNVNVSNSCNGSVLQFPVSGMPTASPVWNGGAVPVVVSLPNAWMIKEPVYSRGSACVALARQRPNSATNAAAAQWIFGSSHREFILLPPSC